jgi:predicted nucleic acid-binding protein
MAAYLLDANHLSPLVTSDHPLRSRVLRQVRFGDSFAITAPALAEALFGIQTAPRAKNNLVEWQRLALVFIDYEVDKTDAERAVVLQLDLRRRGQTLRIIDALIAAVALRYNLILLTTDQDFNAVSGLAVENWLI